MAIDLVNVAAGAGGFVIHGQDARDRSGCSVSSAGDVNGDGFDDLIIGAFAGDGPGNTRAYAGDSYVVFGKASGFAAEIDLAAVAAGNGGFVIHGQDVRDFSGYSVSSAGDINGDGFDDLIIGAVIGDGPAIPASRRATATWCSARPPALRPRSTSPPSRPATAASSSTARMAAISPAGRCPRPATSTATASTT